MTATVFESPQEKILPDIGPRRYGNVDNCMEVVIGGVQVIIPIAVPTMLFTFMREVARINRDTEVRLAIDEVGDKYVFSLLAGDDLYDLWAYTLNSLPECVHHAYRNRL